MQRNDDKSLKVAMDLSHNNPPYYTSSVCQIWLKIVFLSSSVIADLAIQCYTATYILKETQLKEAHIKHCTPNLQAITPLHYDIDHR